MTPYDRAFAGRAAELRAAVVAADPEATSALTAAALAAVLAGAGAALSAHQVLALHRRLVAGRAHASVPAEALLQAVLGGAEPV